MNRGEEFAKGIYTLKAYGEHAMKMRGACETGWHGGYEAAQKDLGWKSVDEELPPMGEEVIVLRSFICADGTELSDPLQISFGHIVDTERCIDYNGWNVPRVKFWMPIPELPKQKKYREVAEATTLYQR